MNKIILRTVSLIAAGGMIFTGANLSPSINTVSAMGTTFMDFSITLEDYNFTLKEGETITLEDLYNHGMKVYVRKAGIHDMVDDPMIDANIPTAMGEIEERSNSSDNFKVICPDRFRNGENTIIVEGELSGFNVSSGTTSFDVNVKLDGVKEEKTPVPNGDMNNDGVTDMTDMTSISLLLLGDADIKELSASGDIDGNGKLEINDLALFKQFISYVKEPDILEDSGWYSVDPELKYYWKLYTNGKLEISDRDNGAADEEKRMYDIRNKVRSLYIADGVTEIKELSGMNALKKVYIPESVKYIGEYSFKNCTSLKEVYIKCSPEYVGHDAFFNTPYLNSNKDEFMMIGTVLHRYNGDSTEVIIPEGVTGISGLAFYGKNMIKKISVPETVKFIGNNAFSECTELESVNIPRGIETIEKAVFSDTESLKKITIPNGVTCIKDLAFSGSGIESVIIPKSVKRIEYGAFSYCKDLKKIEILYRKIRLESIFGGYYGDIIQEGADVIIEGKRIEDISNYNYRDYFNEEPEPDEEGFKEIMNYIESEEHEEIKNEKLSDALDVQIINENAVKIIKVTVTSENENVIYLHTNPEIDEAGRLRIFFSQYITGEQGNNSVVDTYEFVIENKYWEGKEITELTDEDVSCAMGVIIDYSTEI